MDIFNPRAVLNWFGRFKEKPIQIPMDRVLRFSVGDRVVLSKKGLAFLRLYKSTQVGVIEKIEGDHMPYWVKFSDRKIWLEEFCLEKANDC